MKLINRSSLVIKPKQPFVEWLSSTLSEPAPDLHELRQESNSYLFDEADREEDFTEALNRHWQAMFENELAAWDEFGDHWPAERSLELFLSWFEIDHTLMNFDLSDQPLMRANLELEGDMPC